ncbi:MAG TPA: SDR family NAD(P)-dependent oxidoreductase [Candidatus Enterocloster excrementipullorum]|uniref:SDR family NAD(P)-dependent oxidoreductase n=1 Tax=Candidatus Enterocloster excrementipullorum TaxID=2838559 RepID=A0A9D2N289_9FIRM|nr:SDR family NAD(P)-dependent oxidoreductase [Candidatus Enterocloster excrementipullorum]
MSTIFITGSSSGIGKASAKLFAKKGWTVTATMRRPEKETELTEYENIKLYPLDVANPEQVAETVSAVLAQYDVDVLFNNAGYGMKARFEDMTEEFMWKSINTNVLGMVRVTQKFIPYFKQKRAGMILTTTSLAGEMGLVLDGVYAADKWAVTGMCEMLYSELAPFGIQVKTLVPGVVKTNFVMEQIPSEGYEDMIRNQVNLLMPDPDDMEEAGEVAQDAYAAVTDGDKDRMCYVTGTQAKELYAKRQELGDEMFRRYLRDTLLGVNKI